MIFNLKNKIKSIIKFNQSVEKSEYPKLDEYDLFRTKIALNSGGSEFFSFLFSEVSDISKKNIQISYKTSVLIDQNQAINNDTLSQYTNRTKQLFFNKLLNLLNRESFTQHIKSNNFYLDSNSYSHEICSEIHRKYDEFIYYLLQLNDLYISNRNLYLNPEEYIFNNYFKFLRAFIEAVSFNNNGYTFDQTLFFVASKKILKEHLDQYSRKNISLEDKKNIYQNEKESLKFTEESMGNRFPEDLNEIKKKIDRRNSKIIADFNKRENNKSIKINIENNKNGILKCYQILRDSNNINISENDFLKFLIEPYFILNWEGKIIDLLYFLFILRERKIISKNYISFMYSKFTHKGNPIKETNDRKNKIPKLIGNKNEAPSEILSKKSYLKTAAEHL